MKRAMILGVLALALSTTLYRQAIAAKDLILVCEYGPYEIASMTPFTPNTLMEGGAETFRIVDGNLVRGGAKVRNLGDNSETSFAFEIIIRNQAFNVTSTVSIDRYSGAFTAIDIYYSKTGTQTRHSIRQGRCRPAKKKLF